MTGYPHRYSADIGIRIAREASLLCAVTTHLGHLLEERGEPTPIEVWRAVSTVRRYGAELRRTARSGGRPDPTATA